jgi:hypothetical protein
MACIREQVALDKSSFFTEDKKERNAIITSIYKDN